MCKLSLNIVPNVYNSLQSSFLSLAWPLPGRSLLKGNQWEWWDSQQGPLPGLGEVGHSQRGSSGSAGTLDWGPMWSGSQSTCHLQCIPYTPNGPLTLPMLPLMPPIPLLAPEYLHSLPAPNAPWHPYTPYAPPDATYTPGGSWAPTIPASPQCTPDTPYTPDGPQSPWWTPNTP